MVYIIVDYHLSACTNPSWKVLKNTFSPGGRPYYDNDYHIYRTLERCMYACLESFDNCVGVDFSNDNGTIICWIHVNPIDLLTSLDFPIVDQYQFYCSGMSIDESVAY